MPKPPLLVLDDLEGVLTRAPAMDRLRALTEVTILDHPVSPSDEPLLRRARVILALREHTALDRGFFARCPQLRLVLQTGGHAYHVDRTSAAEAGVVVALGRRVTRPMAVVPELAMALMLGLTRRVHEFSQRMQRGEWPTAIGSSLGDKTLGLLGYGRLGRPTARLAEAFGMRVIAWDRRGTRPPADEFGVEFFPLDELLARADVVSIHLRLSDESRRLLDRSALAKMKPGALLVNTSRGAIVDEVALIEALQSGHLGGAGLDVFEVEPLPEDSPLRTLPHVLLTPHVGWRVESVLHEFVAIAADQLEAWVEGCLDEHEVLDPSVLRSHRGDQGT